MKTQADIDNGHRICPVGVAPVKPAAFVMFRDRSLDRVGEESMG